jgi:DNA-binding FadR family transcriptional regulator
VAPRRTPKGVAELSVEVHHAHRRIVEAIIDGDADRAEQYMLRHLTASSLVLE